MTESSFLPLIHPWRLFFHDNHSIKTSSPFYQDLRQAFLARQKSHIPNEICTHWEATQSEGFIKLCLEDEKELEAHYQIIGTFDGKSFLWGDENPSLDEHLVQDAKDLREKLKAKGYSLGLEPKLNAGARDAVALLALATQELSAQSAFVGPNGRSLILMTLNRLETTPAHKTVPVQSYKEPPPSSPLQFVDNLINAQIANQQPNDQELAHIEQTLEQVFQAYQAQDFSYALSQITKLKDRLGRTLFEMEPAGWLFLCEGCVQLALDEKEQAAKAFKIASGAILTFDYTVRMIGLSRACPTEEEQQSHLFGAYIRNPKRFLDAANDQEKSILHTSLKAYHKRNTAVDEQPQEAAKQAWYDALTAYRELEKKAYHLCSQAREQRTQDGAYCEEENIARHKTDLAWREFVLTWMTPGRNSLMSSYSSEPSHCPNLETITDLEMVDEQTCLIMTERDKQSYKDCYRYQLLKTQPPLASHPLWLLDKVWSVWSDEDILLFE